MRQVDGFVQHYEWGDPAFIPDLLGRVPDGRPWAELWFGTHPNGPTLVDGTTPLVEVSGPLPYLLKVLACAEPLSLQAHPNAAQARAGFERGIYPDANAKPELLYALTPFEAFSGLRPVAATLSLFDHLGLTDLAQLLSADGPRTVVERLYRREVDPQPAIDACADSTRPEALWVRRLAEQYRGDPSVAVTLLLNYVTLEPGEALRLDAGNLHAYLHGAGIELLGPSDNVVRGGLTVKHVDTDELLRVLDPTPLEHPVLPVATRYELPGAGVALVRLDAGTTHVATGHELSIDLAGGARYAAPGDEWTTGAVTYVVVPSPGGVE